MLLNRRRSKRNKFIKKDILKRKQENNKTRKKIDQKEKALLQERK